MSEEGKGRGKGIGQRWFIIVKNKNIICSISLADIEYVFWFFFFFCWYNTGVFCWTAHRWMCPCWHGWSGTTQGVAFKKLDVFLYTYHQNCTSLHKCGVKTIFFLTHSSHHGVCLSIFQFKNMGFMFLHKLKWLYTGLKEYTGVTIYKTLPTINSN